MLEANSFRIMMMLGSIIIVAAFSSFLFFVPIISIENNSDGQTIDDYEYVTDSDLELEPGVKEHKLTVLQGMNYYIITRAGHRNSNY